MQYDVTAVCLDTRTGMVVAGPRTERIDPGSNELFDDCQGMWEIEDRYEAFWNRVNASWEFMFPLGTGKIKVLRVEEVG